MKNTALKYKSNFKLSNFWVKNTIVVILLSIIVNHLAEPDNFPFHTSYQFPLFPIFVSFILGMLFLVIARTNFKYFEKTYFTEDVNVRFLLRFLFTTLGYVSVIYTITYFTLNGILNGTSSYSLYNFLTGFSISFLICVIAITLLFANDIYRLHKLAAIEGKFKVDIAGNIELIGMEDLAFFYSSNKIVRLVKTNGQIVTTDYTLNDLEELLNVHSFFRANRQTIIHFRAIEKVQSIENGKLQVLLKPQILNEEPFIITISRYKKQSFLEWFQRKM